MHVFSGIKNIQNYGVAGTRKNGRPSRADKEELLARREELRIFNWNDHYATSYLRKNPHLDNRSIGMYLHNVFVRTI
jgi:hypothetical protein